MHRVFASLLALAVAAPAAASAEEGSKQGSSKASKGPQAKPGPQPKHRKDDPDHPLPPTMEFDDEEVDVPPIIDPLAKDTNTGHFTLALSAAWLVRFGSLQANQPQSDRLGNGWLLAADAGVGVGRTVSLGAWGELANYGSPGNCSECDGTATGFGLFARYHLVQGQRLDPWIAYGIGWRSLTVNGPGNLSQEYSGPVWMRARMGGDWYLFSGVTLGPFVGLDLGTYFNNSEDNSFNRAFNWHATLGFRGMLDIPGR